MSKNKPNLFILGAPKCGTTAMIYYLAQHPQIYVSPVKEPHYFNRDSGHRYYFNEAEYLSLFNEATTKHAYRCEGSVWYLYSEVAVDEILKYNPEARFIVMLRNPASMYFSLHQELLFGGAETEKSPVKAWGLQDIRKDGEQIPIGCSDPRFLQYGEVCKLGKQGKDLLQKVSSEKVVFIFLEDLKNNPDAAYNSVLKFLNLEPLQLSSYKVVNKKKIRKSYWLTTFFSKVNYLKKKAGIKGGVGVANRINKFNVIHDATLVNSEANIPELKEYFEEDILLLEQIIGRDLSHWKS